MTCLMCKGDMAGSYTTYFSDAGESIIIIKNVPCFKCSQCGEVVYTGAVMRRLDNIVDEMKKALTEIAVVTYTDAA